MASSVEIENNNDVTKNNQTIDDESYGVKKKIFKKFNKIFVFFTQIPEISFEDSQIDHFIPYSSPSVLNWETRKPLSNQSIASIEQQNLSEIEQARGNGDTSSMTQLTQLPIDGMLKKYRKKLFLK